MNLDPDKPVSQAQFGALVGITQQAVSELLARGTLGKGASLKAWLASYCGNLRDQASGHVSSEGFDLIRERVLTERVDRELKELMVAEKRATLVNVAQLEPMLMNMVGAFRSELLSRDDKLRDELQALHGIDIDITILNAYTHAALTQFGRYDPGCVGTGAPARVDIDAARAADDDGVGA